MFKRVRCIAPQFHCRNIRISRCLTSITYTLLKSLATVQSVDLRRTSISYIGYNIINIIFTYVYFKFGTINIRYVPKSELIKIWTIYGLDLLCNVLCNGSIFIKKWMLLVFKWYIRIGAEYTQNSEHYDWGVGINHQTLATPPSFTCASI